MTGTFTKSIHAGDRRCFYLISVVCRLPTRWYYQTEAAGKLIRANRKLVRTTKHLKFHHSVYVVLLESAVAKHPSILRVNPKRGPIEAGRVCWNDWITSRS